MAWVVAGTIAVVTAGATVAGALVQADANKKASDAQTSAIQSAAKTQADATATALAVQEAANKEAIAQRQKEIADAVAREREGILDARAYQEAITAADRKYQESLIEADRKYQETAVQDARKYAEQRTQDERKYAAGLTESNRAYEQAGVADARSYQEKQLADALARNQTQYGKITEIMSPYTEAGQKALTQQQALAGLGGVEAQRSAINALSSSPEYQALVQQGEEALLQNASATGGVRGGNTTGALATYRPQMLSQLIEQQYARLGGLSSQGYGASSQLAQAAQNVNTPGGMVNGGSWGNVINQGAQGVTSGAMYGVGQSGMITTPGGGAYGQGNYGTVGVTPSSGLSSLIAQGGNAQAQYQQMLGQLNAQSTSQQGGWVNNTILNPILSGLGAATGYANAFSPPKVK